MNKKFGWPYNAAGIAAIGLPLGIAGYAVSGAAGALVAVVACAIGSLVVLFNTKPSRMEQSSSANRDRAVTDRQ